MKEFLEAFKTGFGLIPSCLFRFIKKLIAPFIVYALFSILPILSVFGIMSLYSVPNVVRIVVKILATIWQIVPLSFSLHLSEFELEATDEDSAELCFAICALVIAALWIKF